MPDSISLSQGEPVQLASLQIEPIQIDIGTDGVEMVGAVSTPVTIELGAIPGPIGPAGDNGLSTYELAVLNGFVGTEAEWIDSLTNHHHPMSDVDGLAAALADKAALVHTHDDRYYTETEADTLLDGKSDTGHTHPQSDITDLVADLAGKAPLVHNHDDRYYTETEADALLAGKAALIHNHDDLYYTQTEDDLLLAGKSDVGHTHDSRYYTEAEVDALLAAINASVALKAGDLLVPGTINAAAWNTTAADRYAAYLVTYAGAVVLTLDSDAPIGARIRFKQMHAGGFSFAAGAGMSLHSRDGGYTSYGLYSVSEAWRISETEWSILGDVA